MPLPIIEGHSTRPQSSTMAASFADTKSRIIHKNYINFGCNITEDKLLITMIKHHYLALLH